MAGVFISYRQSDSKAWAALLRDDLVEIFGPDQIFLDRDTLHAGSWRAQIQQGLADSRITLLLIGRGWLTAADASGRRLDHPDDVHRQEIAAALTHPGATVIPVLVDDAQPPAAADLPEDIRALAECQARRLSDVAAHREIDIRALADDIERLGGPRRLSGESRLQRFVPFKLDEAKARAAFAAWANGVLMAPSGFAEQASLDALAPVWWPFWRVRAAVTALWQGRRGDSRSVDETSHDADGKPVTRRVERIDWQPLQGEAKALLDDLLFGAVEPADADAPTLLDPAALPRVQEAATLPDPAVPVKPATVDAAAAQGRATGLVRSAMEARAKKLIGGDQQELLQLDIRHDSLKLETVLAPAWEGRYTHAGKTYPVLINGDTGEVGAASPLAAKKVALVVGAVVLVLALVIALVGWWASRP